MMRPILVCGAIVVLLQTAGRGQQELTTVRITDNVVVQDTMRLGINTCGDNYWDSSITKIRVAENFEGVMYRMVSWGPIQDENGVAVWFSPPKEAWDAMVGKVRYTLLGGPAKGATGLVKAITTKKIPDGRELTYLVFDKPVAPSPNRQKNGILLELDNLTQGSLRESNDPDFWGSLHNEVSIGDVPPGAFGCAALNLRGSQQQAHYTFVPMWASQGQQNGIWHVQFWAKAKAGRPTLTIDADAAQPQELTPSAEWQKQDLRVEVKGFPENKSGVAVRFIATAGDVLLDDILIWKEEQHRNPTAFRDPVVDLLKKLNPGVMRHLQMGGSNLENNLKPRLQQYGWTRDFGNLVKGGRNRASSYKFNLHDYYVLCEYIGADPWYCVPGTLHVDEVNMLMEYLGAPPDVGHGKVRAQLGHPKPWTEVFRNIYVEFGNEAWNPAGYATGSFNGPDHWKDMIQLGKASPYYKPNVLFVAGSQAGSPSVTEAVLRDVPNADRVGIAPYLMNNTLKEQVEPLSTDDELFRWVFGYTIRRVREPVGRVYRHHELAKAAGKELAIYEHQFHITKPSVQDGGPPIETRNRIIASLGGGLNIINDALMMLKERGIRTQCLFNLNQKQFSEGVKVWGLVPGLNVGDQRYRPTFLAAEIANKVIGGDLVETVHTGANPTFSTTGTFEDDRTKVSTYAGIPTLWSYAFRDGGRRGLILVNLDTSQRHSVRLEFEGGARGGVATAWWLTADEISANNEYETGDPQVSIRQETIGGFATGKVIDMPPFSLVGMAWVTE